MRTILNPALAILLLVALTTEGHGTVSFIEHSIADNYAMPWSVYSIDMDGDNDIDIVGSAAQGNSVNWWENDGSQSFTIHTVSTDVVFPMGVHAADFDTDGDIDVVCGANVSGEVAWFENDGSQIFTKHSFSNWPGAAYVWCDDVDIDGDIDILAAACEGGPGIFGWFENDGNGEFIEHRVLEGWSRANCIHTADVDSDGDIDLLGSASLAGEVAWFENDGEQAFTQHVILNTAGRPSSAHGADLDGDGDIDVLATLCGGFNQLVWFENDGTQSFTQHIVETGFARPKCAWAADVDHDQDVDVLGTAINGNEISWWENDEGGFSKHVLSSSYLGASDVYAGDVDMDGDLDILGTAQLGNQITWWENTLYGFRFVGDPTSGHAPLTVQFTDLSAADPPLTYRAWDFENDGVIDSDEIAPMWTYDNPGTYTVSLEVGNETTSETMVYEDYIRVFDGESAVEFDGSDGYGVCAATAELNLTEMLTLEAWIKPSGWGEVPGAGYGRIVDKANFALYLNGTGSSYNDNSLVFLLKNDAGPPVVSCSTPGSVVLHEWKHVAATYSASNSQVTLFVNGQEMDLTQTGTPSGAIRDNSEDDLFIGNSSGGIYTFCGVIDEVRIWSSSRSGPEIQSTMGEALEGTEDGLVAYWQMTEGSGSVLGDGSSYGHDAALTEASWVQGIHLDLSIEDDLDGVAIPTGLELENLFPNPFMETTAIQFRLPHTAVGIVAIYDINGNRVRVLEEGPFTAGSHTIRWDGTNDLGEPAACGVYFCRLEAASRATSRPVVLTR
jgi:PKD repeat protein